jgi:hypothetical protein
MVDKSRDADVIVPARFDEEAISTDLEHLSNAAGAALVQLRREVDRDGGLPKSRLLRCQDEGRDGTRLEEWVKIRVPWPDGPWGIVFRAVAHPTRPFGLRAIAYGERHPSRTGKPSVYEVGSQRLEQIIARDLRGEDSP